MWRMVYCTALAQEKLSLKVVMAQIYVACICMYMYVCSHNNADAWVRDSWPQTRQRSWTISKSNRYEDISASLIDIWAYIHMYMYACICIYCIWACTNVHMPSKFIMLLYVVSSSWMNSNITLVRAPMWYVEWYHIEKGWTEGVIAVNMINLCWLRIFGRPSTWLTSGCGCLCLWWRTL